MQIIVTGSIAYDYLMRFPGSFREHILTEALHQVSLSFLVDDMTRHWGGVAANIGFTMAKLGLRPRLMATVGRDFGEYRRWLEDAGVDTSLVRQINEVFTASFFCNTDQENNQIASFYSGAMGHARDYSLTDAGVDHADLVVISPNDPAAMTQLAQECRERGFRFVYDPSQQVARLSGEDLKRDMDGAYLMVVNQYEAHIICEKAGLTMQDLRHMIDLLVVTHGADGSEIYTDGEIIRVPAFSPRVIQDPTGAGDAFRAGLLTGLVHELPLKLAGEIGALCATYVLEQIGTQNHSYSLEDFIARFREYTSDDGMLEILQNGRLQEPGHDR